MLNVIDSIDLKHEIFEIRNHLKQVFEITIQNTDIFNNMIKVLNVQNDVQIA
jgi:hypothetical protein